jgi:hypothetical protein
VQIIVEQGLAGGSRRAPPAASRTRATRSASSRFRTASSSGAFRISGVRLESGTHQLVNGCVVLRLLKLV